MRVWTSFVEGSPSSAQESVAAEYRPRSALGWSCCWAGSGTAGACGIDGEVGSGGVRAGADDVVGGDVVGDASTSMADMDTRLTGTGRRHVLPMPTPIRNQIRYAWNHFHRNKFQAPHQQNHFFLTVSDLDSDLNSTRAHVSDRTV